MYYLKLPSERSFAAQYISNVSRLEFSSTESDTRGFLYLFPNSDAHFDIRVRIWVVNISYTVFVCAGKGVIDIIFFYLDC